MLRVLEYLDRCFLHSYPDMLATMNRVIRQLSLLQQKAQSLIRWIRWLGRKELRPEEINRVRTQIRNETENLNRTLDRLENKSFFESYQEEIRYILLREGITDIFRGEEERNLRIEIEERKKPAVKGNIDQDGTEITKITVHDFAVAESIRETIRETLAAAFQAEYPERRPVIPQLSLLQQKAQSLIRWIRWLGRKELRPEEINRVRTQIRNETENLNRTLDRLENDQKTRQSDSKSFFESYQEEIRYILLGEKFTDIFLGEEERNLHMRKRYFPFPNEIEERERNTPVRGTIDQDGNIVLYNKKDFAIASTDLEDFTLELIPDGTEITKITVYDFAVAESIRETLMYAFQAEYPELRPVRGTIDQDGNIVLYNKKDFAIASTDLEDFTPELIPDGTEITYFEVYGEDEMQHFEPVPEDFEVGPRDFYEGPSGLDDFPD